MNLPDLPIAAANWRAIIAHYAGADARLSLWQAASTIFLLVAGLIFAYQLMDVAPWASALLVLPLAGLLVRTFIIMHDCAHGSFLPWPRVNDALGFITGVLTFTPFQQWRREHALHHASSGDLDRRGYGDVRTLTVAEYRGLSRWGRIKYRLYRHPIVLFGIGPLHMIILQRFRAPSLATGPKQLWNVWMTNAALVGLALGRWGTRARRARWGVVLVAAHSSAAVPRRACRVHRPPEERCLRSCS